MATGQLARARKISAVLIAQNMGLVAKVVNKYRVKQVFLSFADAREDLMQAGVIGLLKSFDAFNPARGKFSSIAMWKILHEVQRELCKQMTTTYPRSNRREIRLQVSDLSEEFLSHDARKDIEARSDLTALLDELAANCTEQEQTYISALLNGLTDRSARLLAKLSEDECTKIRGRLASTLQISY